METKCEGINPLVRSRGLPWRDLPTRQVGQAGALQAGMFILMEPGEHLQGANQTYILYFLYHPKVPPDNNGSERAIRPIKVKQKISGQFTSAQGANGFAILRSIIDTTIKSGQNVLNALNLIVKLGTE